ncbi:hypothetical protein L835_1372 [Mycobacteroides abscessus MAB_110811_1470]|nr:hypothetical protein L835_1372 [Mycobacteroides abscessus MAB_110811_1470]
MTTLTALLLGDVNNPAPRITYYDDAAGERIELSTVTLANWAAKTANMLRDEFGAGPGSTVAVRLPAHWQTAAYCLEFGGPVQNWCSATPAPMWRSARSVTNRMPMRCACCPWMRSDGRYPIYRSD